jgi:hypothetical protein
MRDGDGSGRGSAFHSSSSDNDAGNGEGVGVALGVHLGMNVVVGLGRTGLTPRRSSGYTWEAAGRRAKGGDAADEVEDGAMDEDED